MKKLSYNWKNRSGLTSLSAGATGILLLGIVGCGGGGGSNARTVPTASPTNIPSIDPQPTKTPVPTPTPVTGPGTPTDPSACDASTYTPNYVPGLLAGTNDPNASPGRQKLSFWKAFAIRIYFNPVAGNTAARKALTVAGFNQWVTSTNNRVRWVETDDKTVADAVINLETYDPAASGSTVGLTYSANVPGSAELVSYYQDVNSPANARSGYMIVGFTGDNAYDQSTAAHEFGHLLGLGGHSPDTADLMYYTGNTSGAVTTPDLNSLRTAYCDNFNQSGARLARKAPITGPLVHHVYR